MASSLVNRFVAVERALRTAAPDRLLDSLRPALATGYGVVTAELLLADYGLTVLRPVPSHGQPATAGPADSHAPAPGDAESVSINNSPEGRAFGSQEPRVEASHEGFTRVHVPVSVRGDRLGVLSVLLPDTACSPETLSDLVDVGEVLGHQVLVAERDTDVYLQARRRDRLTLAAEMQWQLLPARACARREYAMGAQLEPAYAIHGDNFDWSTSEDRLTLTVTNGMGEGIEASLLTNLAVNALRNARRAGIPIADQAALADQAVFGVHRGKAFLSTLLLEFDLATGAVHVVDAGSPQLLRLRGGVVEPIPFEAQLPLGMFEETNYVAQEFRVEPGDRLVFVSDGVYAVAAPGGERALDRAIGATRLLPPAEMPRAMLAELSRRRGSRVPDDDALVVCLDWHGR